MNLFELNKFIEKEKIKGNEQILHYKLEKTKVILPIFYCNFNDYSICNFFKKEEKEAWE